MGWGFGVQKGEERRVVKTGLDGTTPSSRCLRYNDSYDLIIG